MQMELSEPKSNPTVSKMGKTEQKHRFASDVNNDVDKISNSKAEMYNNVEPGSLGIYTLELSGILGCFTGRCTRISKPVGFSLSYEPPIYDIDAADLYIAYVAFGSYLVLAGLALGLKGK